MSRYLSMALHHGAPWRFQLPTPAELFAGLIYRDDEWCPALRDPYCYPVYWAAARFLRPRAVLELGTWFGYSLVAIVAGASGQPIRRPAGAASSSSASWEPASIVSIDNQSMRNRFVLPSQEVAAANLRACTGRRGRFIVGDRNTPELAAGELFDLVHVDASHTVDDLRADLLFAREHLFAPGGTILADDMGRAPALWRELVAEADRLGLAVDFLPTRNGLAVLSM